MQEMLKFTFYLFYPVIQSGFYIVSAFLEIFLFLHCEKQGYFLI